MKRIKGCGQKKSYDSPEMALIARWVIYRKGEAGIQPYRCADCDRWHLGRDE